MSAVISFPVLGDGYPVGCLRYGYTNGHPLHSAACRICGWAIHDEHSFEAVALLLPIHLSRDHGVHGIGVDLSILPWNHQARRYDSTEETLATLAMAWGDHEWVAGSLRVTWRGSLVADRDGVLIGWGQPKAPMGLVVLIPGRAFPESDLAADSYDQVAGMGA